MIPHHPIELFLNLNLSPKELQSHAECPEDSFNWNNEVPQNMMVPSAKRIWDISTQFLLPPGLKFEPNMLPLPPAIISSNLPLQMETRLTTVDQLAFDS